MGNNERHQRRHARSDQVPGGSGLYRPALRSPHRDGRENSAGGPERPGEHTQTGRSGFEKSWGAERVCGSHRGMLRYVFGGGAVSVV